jgi:hypothetical protein
MEHLFDSLSKQLAQVSRRQAIGTFFRGAVGALVASTWFGSRSAKAQSAACAACGTCQIYDASTGALTSCTNACEAQVVCNAVQSHAGYTDLAAVLTSTNGLQATGYSLLLLETTNYKTAVFQTTYASSQVPSNTADLLVVWGPAKGQVTAYAINYVSGVPTYSYQAAANGMQQVFLPQVPPASAPRASTKAVSPDETKEVCEYALLTCLAGATLGATGLCLAAAAGVAEAIATYGATTPTAISLAQACDTAFANGRSACEAIIEDWCECPKGTTECVLPDGTFKCCTCADYCFAPYTCVNNACVMGTCAIGGVPCAGAYGFSFICCGTVNNFNVCCGPTTGYTRECCIGNCASYPSSGNCGDGIL